jgi:hypothetical protein
MGDHADVEETLVENVVKLAELDELEIEDETEDDTMLDEESTTLIGTDDRGIETELDDDRVLEELRVDDGLWSEEL